ncbi:putative Twisted gastrulation 1-B-like [Homarus americanus]|uniref:Putative Twisted gastrulation 1-B-like n=1 Tax=Homarus americanus TaxID=6706 RepID=A0A8J5JF14_HOMAM|nr:putative Twisted gastrulation 1-B-like [Homarus americanus]
MLNTHSPPLPIRRLPQDEGEVESPRCLLQDTDIHGVRGRGEASGVVLRPGVVDEGGEVHRDGVKNVAVKVPDEEPHQEVLTIPHVRSEDEKVVARGSDWGVLLEDSFILLPLNRKPRVGPERWRQGRLNPRVRFADLAREGSSSLAWILKRYGRCSTPWQLPRKGLDFNVDQRQDRKPHEGLHSSHTCQVVMPVTLAPRYTIHTQAPPQWPPKTVIASKTSSDFSSTHTFLTHATQDAMVHGSMGELGRGVRGRAGYVGVQRGGVCQHGQQVHVDSGVQLFQALTGDKDPLLRWTAMTFPIDLALSDIDTTTLDKNKYKLGE